MSDRPNIVLITTDQQRGDCLGIDGHPVLQTPNLDALAAGGARFRRGTTECPSCFPARRSLMSGVSAAGQGMVGMRGSAWDPPHTLAGLLRDGGYQTKLVGKLHLQPRGKRFGFEHQELSDGPYVPGDNYDRWLHERWGRTEQDPGIAHGVDCNGWIGRPGHLPEEQTHTYWCVDRAIRFLEHDLDPTAPFFLNVSLFDPHPPCAPPAWYYQRYIDRDLPAPAIGDWAEDPGERPGYAPTATRLHLQEHHQRCLQAAYYGTCNFIDDQVGRLLQYMRRHGHAGNTLFIYTSDHGEMLGDHHLFRKCWPYEASTRVPFLVHAPHEWGLDRGIVSDCPVGLQDVLPTAVDAAGLEVPEICTGRSLLPILRGETDSVRDVFHAEDCGTYSREDGYHLLLSDRYKYVWYAQRETEHLFDLAEDPNETRDLALADGAEERLAPWRKRLIDILKDRPEGFVKDGELVRGADYQHIVPDHEADAFKGYL